MARPPHTHTQLTPPYLESQSNTTQINAKAHRYITDASLPGHAETTEPQHSTQTHATTPAHRKHRPITRADTHAQGVRTKAPKHTTHPSPGHITHDTALHAQHRFPPHNARYTASTSQTQASTHASPAPASKLPQTRRDKNQGAHWLICGSGFRLRSAGLGPQLRPAPLP